MSAQVKLPPCPMWIAASTDQRGVDPNAPAPLKADAPNSASAIAEQLTYHAGIPKVAAYAIAQVMNLASRAPVRDRIRDFFRQQFTPELLTGGLLDKDLDTGMLNGTGVVGEFSRPHFEAMFHGRHATDYTIDGAKTRGMSQAQLKAFVADKAETIGAGPAQKFIANAEMVKLLLGVFGRDAHGPDGPTKIIRARDVEVFFEHRIFPHEHLDAAIERAYPTERSAALATGAQDPVAAMQATALKSACPMAGLMAALGGDGDPATRAAQHQAATPESRATD